MRKQLVEYYALIEEGPGYAEGYALMLQQEPTVKEILKRLDPELADNDFSDRGQALYAVDSGLGILAAQEACETRLAPDIPVLSADHFHRWAWQAARTLWDSAHYRHAVQAAATAIIDHTQNKLGRRDVADTQLMQEALSPNPPEPGKPRLRCPGDPSSPTTQSRQRGAFQSAVGAPRRDPQPRNPRTR